MSSRFFHWLFAALLCFIALYLIALGGYLAYLGGSSYYLIAGVATALVAVLVIQGNSLARAAYGGIIAVTLIWALWESGLDLLALLPRTAAWLVLGIWFLTPWYEKSLKLHPNSGRPIRKSFLLYPSIATVLALAIASGQGYTHNDTGTVQAISDLSPTTDWRHYGNSAGGTRFAEVDQINTQNVGNLKEVWRYRSGTEEDFKATPLQVGNRLYLCGALNVLIALDSDSGEEIWRYDPELEKSASHQYAITCRGVSYHEAPPDYSGECPTRIVSGTVDASLIAVDAKTGEPCQTFGNDGVVNLRKGLGAHSLDQYYVTSPPLVANDILVVGGLVIDSQTLGLPSGVVRAFDALTGDFVWAWDLGNPGEYGEPDEGQTYTPGTPNVWSLMSYDPELDLIYAPTGNASPDYYGGERRAVDDEWSSALVALDAQSGAPRWKFQTVHHDVWDYDLPAQPVLVDVTRNGKTVPSVAVATKTGEIFLLDRRDGSPVYPIEEREVPQDPEHNEYLSPTQPSSPLPNFHPYRHEKDMWGLTPLDHLACRIEYKMLRYEGMFTPPTKTGTLLSPGNFGGFNWGSVSVDADSGLLIAAPMLLTHRLKLYTAQQVAQAGPIAALALGEQHPAVRMDPQAPVPKPRPVNSDDPYDHARILYYGVPSPFMSRLGTQVPCFEPPWSRLAVIDLNTNKLLWSRPLGSMNESGPFGLRSGLPFNVGVAVRAGTLTTRGGLVFVSSTMDKKARAFDLRTGEIKWSTDLPGNGQSTPMTYRSNSSGKQYLIVTVPNPSWVYPRDPSTGQYLDSTSVKDGKGGYVIAYALGK